MKYRGYDITSNTLNDLLWVSKDGFGIGWADSEAAARAKIDGLLNPTAAAKLEEQRKLLEDISKHVLADLLARSDRWPTDWDGHELRELLYHAFAEQRTVLMREKTGSGRRRRIACERDMLKFDLY